MHFRKMKACVGLTKVLDVLEHSGGKFVRLQHSVCS